MNRALTMISPRTEGMIDVSPEYVQTSEVWAAIMNAKALEFDRLDAVSEDVQLQLSPHTATWGLSFWEQSVGIVPRSTASYEQRRPVVLTRLRNSENFSLEMIRKIAADYGDPVDISIDTDAMIITVIFNRGIPPHIDEFKQAVESVIHAHIGPVYTYRYIASRVTAYLGTRQTVGVHVTIKPYTLDDYTTSAHFWAAGLARMSAKVLIKCKQGV